jgi:hypothetical protein
MITGLPVYISIVFALTVLLTLYFIIKAGARSTTAISILLLLLIYQGVLGYTKFFTVTDTVPPRFPLLILPSLLILIFLFVTKKGKQFLDSLDSKWLTWLHVVRLPVEIVLFWLFVHKQIPQLMTFEGRNFDILSGITAPLITYFGYTKFKLGKPVLLLWNFICLGLVLNILINGLLSAPTPIQQFAFDQPNVGILHFPFVWLPGFIVPAVLLAHLACIRQLLKK